MTLTYFHYVLPFVICVESVHRIDKRLVAGHRRKVVKQPYRTKKFKQQQKMAQANGKIVLVTGGAGYIGSHCVVTLQEAGYDVIALDNFANSVDDGHDGSIALKRVEKITGKPVTFYKCDLLDTTDLETIFQNVGVTIDLIIQMSHILF